MNKVVIHHVLIETNLYHFIVLQGHFHIVKLLTLEKHCNPPNKMLTTPLHYAAEWGHLQVVQFLVEELKCPQLEKYLW